MNIETLRERLTLYYEAERQILSGAQSYKLGDRELRRADLSQIRSAITDIQNQIALLENGQGMMKRAVFID